MYNRQTGGFQICLLFSSIMIYGWLLGSWRKCMCFWLLFSMYFEARHVFGMLLSASSHLGISLQLVFVFCVCEILEKESGRFAVKVCASFAVAKPWALCATYPIVFVRICSRYQSCWRQASHLASRWDNAAKIIALSSSRIKMEFYFTHLQTCA